MNLSSLLLPEGEFRVIRCDIADKLIACGDGDSALLYLYALRHGDQADEKTVIRTLNFTKERFDRAIFTLTGLIVRENAASLASVSASKPKMPKYTPNELRQARESDHKFAAVCNAAEKAFGTTLSESRVRSLFGIYDFLGLPAEVIIELVSYLKRDRDKLTKYDIEREAYLWSDMGIYTYQQAQDYLTRVEAMKPLIHAIYAVLQIVGREPSLQERNFAADCVKKGFPPEAVELACKRMQQHIGKHSLAYLQKILGQWDEKGVHTVAEITALEPESAYKRSAVPAAQPDKLEDWEQQWLAEVEQRKRSLEKDGDSVPPAAPDAASPLPSDTSATPPDQLEDWEQQWLAEMEQRKRALTKEG